MIMSVSQDLPSILTSTRQALALHKEQKEVDVIVRTNCICFKRTEGLNSSIVNSQDSNFSPQLLVHSQWWSNLATQRLHSLQGSSEWDIIPQPSDGTYSNNALIAGDVLRYMLSSNERLQDQPYRCCYLSIESIHSNEEASFMNLGAWWCRDPLGSSWWNKQRATLPPRIWRSPVSIIL